MPNPRRFKVLSIQEIIPQKFEPNLVSGGQVARKLAPLAGIAELDRSAQLGTRRANHAASEFDFCTFLAICSSTFFGEKRGSARFWQPLFIHFPPPHASKPRIPREFVGRWV
jgi:hypothetical protein